MRERSEKQRDVRTEGQEMKIHHTSGQRACAQGDGQTWSLVSRSHQRCGRINVPKAAMAQIVASSTKLAMRKNAPFMSCIERGPMSSPPMLSLYHFNQFANRNHNAMILRVISFEEERSIEGRVASIHVSRYRTSPMKFGPGREQCGLSA